MKEHGIAAQESEWVCGKCGVPLVSAKVQVRYLGTTLTVDLLKCSACDIVMVTEEMAIGKMSDAEQVLEDK
jgi:hypothetical protein